MTDITAVPCIVMLTGNHGKRPGFGTTRDLLRCRAFSSASNKSPAERTLLAKFANLGKDQGIPRPVGIGRGMEVGMAGKPTATGCGVPREPASDFLFPPPCLPVPVPVHRPIPSSVPGLMIPLPRGPLVFPQPSLMQCQIAQPGRPQDSGQARLGNFGPSHQAIEASHRCAERRPTCFPRWLFLYFFSPSPMRSVSDGDAGSV